MFISLFINRSIVKIRRMRESVRGKKIRTLTQAREKAYEG